MSKIKVYCVICNKAFEKKETNSRNKKCTDYYGGVYFCIEGNKLGAHFCNECWKNLIEYAKYEKFI